MTGSLFDETPMQYESHDALIAAMHTLTDDPLAETGNRMVISRGNPEADLMVIGEGPGAEEDQQGKPYVGRSGKLLNKILEAAGFDSQNGVYVTNTVFRRPPDNRDPSLDELAYYKSYLMELIRLVDPKLIVTTGKYSMWQVIGAERLGVKRLNQLRITKLRGNWHEIDGRWVMPIFHPAYLLRQPSREKGKPKWLTWQDAQAIRHKYDEIGGRSDLLLPTNEAGT